jgi:ethanolamine ammonia-lyase small subunit
MNAIFCRNWTMEPSAPQGRRDLEPELSRVLEQVRQRTPARILVGRAGGSYRTATALELRADHAAARDAVTAELDLVRDVGAEFVERWGLFEVRSNARSKQEFLLHPELGRSLDGPARAEVVRRCPAGVDLQVAIGDGLSAAAVAAQVPGLLPLLEAEAASRGWRLGQPLFVRHCRVGVLNDIGDLLDPTVAILLIGERPGLATALGLSAYMAYRPRAGHDDAQRNLISNIHSRGVSLEEAARRIGALAAQMMRLEASGVDVKEVSAGTIPFDLRPMTRGEIED